MSAEKVIKSLLGADATVAALVNGRIWPGTVPLNSPMPVIAYNHISSVSKTMVSLADADSLIVTRIQITVMAKSYPEVKNILQAVNRACDLQRGVIAGVRVSSVIGDALGPDMRDDDATLYMQSADFKVTWTDVR
jgi:hypothetical protein